jgi:hypothetical protein
VQRTLLYGFATLVAFGLLVTACGGDDDGSAAQRGTTEERATTEGQATTTAPAEKPKPSEECKRVPAALVAAIQEGFTTRGVTLRRAYGVRSNDLKNAWYISGDLQGPGLEGRDDIATWVKSGDLVVGGGLILASNAVAKEFSDWGAAAQPGSPAAEAASMENHGAEESQDCVRAS